VNYVSNKDLWYSSRP